MHSKPLHLVIAINRKYIRYAYVMLTSLLLHTTCDVHVYILHRELAPADQQTFDQLAHSYPVTFHFIHVPDALLPPQKVLATSAWGDVYKRQSSYCAGYWLQHFSSTTCSFPCLRHASSASLISSSDAIPQDIIIGFPLLAVDVYKRQIFYLAIRI